MGIFRLLGFGTNWDRVNRMELAKRLYDAGIVVKNMTHLEAYGYDVEKFFADNTDGIKKD